MNKMMIVMLLLTTALFGSNAYADVAAGTINLSGNVPAYFEMQVRGVPGDIDLSPGTVVAGRLIGILHFKYNIDAGSVALGADTATKTFENSANAAYPFAVDPSYTAPACNTLAGNSVTTANILAGAGAEELTLTNKATDLLANNAGLGIEEDCQLQIGYSAIALGSLPIADTYAVGLTVTFTSN